MATVPKQKPTDQFWLSGDGKILIREGTKKNDAGYSHVSGPKVEPVKFKVGDYGHAVSSAWVRGQIASRKAMPLAFDNIPIYNGKIALVHFGETYQIELTNHMHNYRNTCAAFAGICDGQFVIIDFFVRKHTKTNNRTVHGRVWSTGTHGERKFIILEQ